MSLRSDNYTEAISLFRRAVSLHPSSSVLRCFLGMALQASLSELPSAEKELREAMLLDPSNPQPPFQLGRLLHRLGRLEVRACWSWW